MDSIRFLLQAADDPPTGALYALYGALGFLLAGMAAAHARRLYRADGWQRATVDRAGLALFACGAAGLALYFSVSRFSGRPADMFLLDIPQLFRAIGIPGLVLMVSVYFPGRWWRWAFVAATAVLVVAILVL